VPRFPEQFIHQVQQATDIVELISQYVALKRKGSEYVGLCPFHDDKNPSMRVSPTKQIFKCFACGAGVSVFHFVMRYENISFPEAVRMLAERVHIPLPDTQAPVRPVAEGLSKNDLRLVTAFAAAFFHKQLLASAGADALAYARRRQLTDESIERFGLGYAPESWDALINAARREGFSDAQLVAAGLAAERDGGGCYDRFRNRLIFPISDAGDRVIAFGGRALAAEERAKYLNSPETSLFDKSGELFALNWSREGIRESGQAIVVEGYMDALVPLQAGLTNVVAPLGTALTDRQVRALSRNRAKEVVLLFDADVAGATAAERALEKFLAQQVNVRVATIPAGKDPCDFVLAEGPEAMRELVAAAPDAIEYAWQRRQADLAAAGGHLPDRGRVVEEFLRLIVSSSAYGAIDEMKRGQLAQHIGHIMNVPPRELQQMMHRLGRRGRPAATAAAATERTSDERLVALAERQILEVLICKPDLFDTVAERLDAGDFRDPRLRVVADCIWRLGEAGRLELDSLLSAEDLIEYGPLLANLATEGEVRGNYENTLDGAVGKLLYRKGLQEYREVKAGGIDADEALREIQRRLRGDPDQPGRRPMIQ